MNGNGAYEKRLDKKIFKEKPGIHIAHVTLHTSYTQKTTANSSMM